MEDLQVCTDDELQKEIKRTQEVLGPHITHPPLSEKHLQRPPFRFLHDIVRSIIQQTGFMRGVFTKDELNYAKFESNIDVKRMFLNKLILTAGEGATGAYSAIDMNVKPSKILSGKEPEKTNKLLQILALGIEQEKKLQANQGKVWDKEKGLLCKSPQHRNDIGREEIAISSGGNNISSSTTTTKVQAQNAKTKVPSQTTNSSSSSKKKEMKIPTKSSNLIKNLPLTFNGNETGVKTRRQSQSQSTPVENIKGQTISTTQDKKQPMGSPKMNTNVPNEKVIALKGKNNTLPAAVPASSSKASPDKKSNRKVALAIPQEDATTSDALMLKASMKTNTKLVNDSKHEKIVSVPSLTTAASKRSASQSQVVIHTSVTSSKNTNIKEKGEHTAASRKISEEEIMSSTDLGTTSNGNKDRTFDKNNNIIAKLAQKSASLAYVDVTKTGNGKCVETIKETEVGSFGNNLEECQGKPTTAKVRETEDFQMQLISGASGTTGKSRSDVSICKSNSQTSTSLIVMDEEDFYGGGVSSTEQISKVKPSVPDLKVLDFEIMDEVEDMTTTEDTEKRNHDEIALENPQDPDESSDFTHKRPESHQSQSSGNGSREKISSRPTTVRRPPPSRNFQPFIFNRIDDTYRPPEGKVNNVIIESNMEDEPNDEAFVVTEIADPMRTTSERLLASKDPFEEEELLPQQRGFLVNQIIQSQHALTRVKQSDKLPDPMDNSKRSRENDTAEIDKLKNLIQILAKNANPFSRLLDYVEEDAELIANDLQHWRNEDKRLDLEIEIAKEETGKSLEPLQKELSEVETKIKAKEREISATKMKILKLEKRIESVLNGLDRLVPSDIKLSEILPSRIEVMKMVDTEDANSHEDKRAVLPLSYFCS